MNGEYKDIYTEETQRIIDRRFRETRNLEQQVGQYQPVIDMLMQLPDRRRRHGQAVPSHRKR